MQLLESKKQSSRRAQNVETIARYVHGCAHAGDARGRDRVQTLAYYVGDGRGHVRAVMFRRADYCSPRILPSSKLNTKIQYPLETLPVAPA